MTRLCLAAFTILLASSAGAQTNSQGNDWYDWDECMYYLESFEDCGEEPPRPAQEPPPAPPPTPPPPPPPPPPSQAEQLRAQAWTAYEAGSYDDVIRLASESIALDPSLWESWHFRAWSRYFKGQYAEAADDHAKTVEIGPQGDAYLSFSVALCKSLAGASQQSLEWAGRALGIDPGFYLALSQMGYAYFDLGELDLAREKFAAAVARDAAPGDAHLGLALVAGARGDAAGAQQHLADAKARAPDLGAIGVGMNATRRFTAKQAAALAALEPAKP
jgi:tetratricopeptide (TPR) repeat protein